MTAILAIAAAVIIAYIIYKLVKVSKDDYPAETIGDDEEDAQAPPPYTEGIYDQINPLL
ncbi:MAG TPA: hypothetical protein PL045_09655 [Chitinophagaceae bacterium]|nr:hypothetical protein [Chitinophagaceae bacterium]